MFRFQRVTTAMAILVGVVLATILAYTLTSRCAR